MKKLYHATTEENLSSILTKGIRQGLDGLIYLSDTFDHAARFLYFRTAKTIVVFEIDTTKLEKNKIKKSYDHSIDFFGCTAWTYSKKIPPEALTLNIMKYDFSGEGVY